MPNGRLCCAAGVCCVRPAAVQAMSELLVETLKCEPEEAKLVSTWIHEHFALIPRGHGLEDVIHYIQSHDKP